MKELKRVKQKRKIKLFIVLTNCKSDAYKEANERMVLIIELGKEGGRRDEEGALPHFLVCGCLLKSKSMFDTRILYIVVFKKNNNLF